MRTDRSKLLATLIAIGGLLYTVSPVDLIPEILAGPSGFGDDAVVLVGATVAIVWVLTARRRRRAATTR